MCVVSTSQEYASCACGCHLELLLRIQTGMALLDFNHPSLSTAATMNAPTYMMLAVLTIALSWPGFDTDCEPRPTPEISLLVPIVLTG